MRFGIILAGLLMTTAMPAVSQTIGLVIGNEDYRAMRDVRNGDGITTSVEDLERAGVEIVSRRDATLEDTLWVLSDFGQRAANAETLLIALSGRFVHTPTETFFMPTDSEAGPMATLPGRALPLSTVFAWLSAHPGEALLMLATDGQDADISPLMTMGLGQLDIPQGVTVLAGAPREMRAFMRKSLPRPGRPFVGAARQAGLSVTGYAPNTHILIDAVAPQAPTTANDRRDDILGWRAASGENTVEAYEGYLESHPNGEFARMAENRIKSLTDTPEARAERTEQALDLSRDARRDIQRDLTLLGFNTRGIDGIFGRGTRSAVADWQRAEQFEVTGYMDRAQVDALNTMAEARALELEAEAERRRQQQLAADLAFWDQTGAGRNEDGLRLYIEKYPDGEFAEIARERLDRIENQKRADASAIDRQRWDVAVRRDTIEGYEEYLNTDPGGRFRGEALARLTDLENARANSGLQQAAVREEQSMNLSPRTRQIVEARLKGLGLKPGKVDGVFDDKSRRAIRRYQAARNMDETGYLSEAMVVQLMADTVRQIFR